MALVFPEHCCHASKKNIQGLLDMCFDFESPLQQFSVHALCMDAVHIDCYSVVIWLHRTGVRIL